MTINEEIHTKLHYKDVAIISVMFEAYKKQCGNPKSEVLKRAEKMINRFGNEIYAHPKFDFTKD